MIRKEQTALLTTVNAPYRSYMDGPALAAALETGDVTKGQVNSFLTEIDVRAQKGFAKAYGISETALQKTATAYAEWSGRKPALLL